MYIYDLYTQHTKLINYVLYKIYTKYKFKNLNSNELNNFKYLLKKKKILTHWFIEAVCPF